MAMRFILFSLFLIGSYTGFSQLILNEISQGPAGAQEYVELVVAGNQTCSTPVPCVDLRGIVLDDNNGYFASGSGTGIATGAIRFADVTFWSCVPQGTLIVIYNNLDVNPALPPDDISLNDGNCRLIIPVNSSLLEGQSITPSTTDATYPSASNWLAGSGAWTQIGMANGGDSFQIRANITAATPYHSVSWGNNTSNIQIAFAGSAGSTVYSFNNLNSNDWFQQVNWVAGVTGTDETPGAPNSTQNAQWIAQMNPTCGIGNPLTLNVLESTVSCAGDCNGSLVATASGGAGNYAYSWSNGQLTSTISGLCAGSYSVSVTDANGCTVTQNATVTDGYPHPNMSISSNSPYTLSSNPDQISVTPPAGTWFSDCGTCVSNTGLFNPQISGAGSFNVCYVGYNGSCHDTICTSVVVTSCTVDTSYSAQSACFGDSLFISGIYLFNDSIVYSNQLDANGCVLTTVTAVNFLVCPDFNPEVILPNIFTPNGDNSNDTWYPTISFGTLEEGFITNRWGNLVAKLDATHTTWDGKINNEPASEGVYFVRIKVLLANDSVQIYQGIIELFR